MHFATVIWNNKGLQPGIKINGNAKDYCMINYSIPDGSNPVLN